MFKERLIASILVIILALSVTACGDGPGGGSREKDDGKAVKNDKMTDVFDEGTDVSAGSEPASGDGDDTADAPGGVFALSSIAVGDIIEFGGYDWIVLDIDNGKALILSEKTLTGMAYNAESMEMTWQDSGIRQFLNGPFYDENFNAEEKAQIAETTVVNDINPWYSMSGGDDTVDKLFLLSLKEVVIYFGDSGHFADRPEQAFIDDAYNGARIADSSDTGEPSWWWLRSPGSLSINAALVSPDGFIRVSGVWIVDNNSGVRPALWLDIPDDIEVIEPDIAAEILEGKTRHLKFGDYTWRVLDIQGDKALIITEGLIAKLQYHDSFTEITWENCALRRYLNGDFLEMFSDNQQAMILETRVSNPDNLWFGTNGGNDTRDKVFLLSLEEADELFGNSGKYRDKVSYNDVDFSSPGNKDRAVMYAADRWTTWWLRSPGREDSNAATIHPEGHVKVSGLSVSTLNGVRPALWLSLEP